MVNSVAFLVNSDRLFTSGAPRCCGGPKVVPVRHSRCGTGRGSRIFRPRGSHATRDCARLIFSALIAPPVAAILPPPTGKGRVLVSWLIRCNPTRAHGLQ